MAQTNSKTELNQAAEQFVAPQTSPELASYAIDLFREQSSTGSQATILRADVKTIAQNKTQNQKASSTQTWLDDLTAHVTGPMNAQFHRMAMSRPGQEIAPAQVTGASGDQLSLPFSVKFVADVAADLRKGENGSLTLAALPPLLIGVARFIPGLKGLGRKAATIEAAEETAITGAEAEAQGKSTSKGEAETKGEVETGAGHGGPHVGIASTPEMAAAGRALAEMHAASKPQAGEQALDAFTAQMNTGYLAVEQAQAKLGTATLPITGDHAPDISSPSIKRATPDPIAINSIGHVTDNPQVLRAQEIEAANTSYFQERVPTVGFPRLGNRVVKTDVVMIGGGISGANAASQSARQGLHVTVLDSGDIAGKTSAMGGSFITRIADGMVSRLPRDFAQQRTALYYDAHQDVMNRARGLSTLMEAPNRRFVYDPRYIEGLSHEFDIMRGFDPKMTFETGSSAFPQSVAAIVEHDAGGFVLREFVFKELKDNPNIAAFANSAASRIEFSNVGKPIRVRTTDGGTVEADQLVFTTGGLPAPFAHLAPKFEPIQSFSLTARTAGGRTMPGGMLDAGGDEHGVWAPAAPYNYMRRIDVKDPELIGFGGADKFLAEEPAVRAVDNVELVNQLRKVFPDAKVVNPPWSGILHVAHDDTVMVEQLADHPNVKIITSPTGIGVIASNAGAKELVRGIMLDRSQWDNFFTPERPSLQQ